MLPSKAVSTTSVSRVYVPHSSLFGDGYYQCNGRNDQDLINYLLETFGAVELSDGDFYTTGPIRVPPAANLTGQGFGRTRITMLGETNGVEVADATNHTQRCKLADFELVGNLKAKHGMYLPGAKNWRVTDVKIRAFTNDGHSSIYLSGNDGQRVGCFYNEFRGCEIRGSTYGVTMTGVVTDGQTNANHWYGGKMQNHTRAINCEQPSQGNSFSFPAIEDMAGGILYYTDGRGNILYAGYLESRDATYVEFGPNSTWNVAYDLPFVPDSSTPVVNRGIQNHVTMQRQDSARQYLYEGTVVHADFDGTIRETV